MLLTACTGSAEPTRTPPPTQPLNTAQPTATDVPVQPTQTLTLPPSAADLARTATAQAPTPDPTAQARALQGRLALEAVSGEVGIPISSLQVAAVTGVRAGRQIDGCGRAQSGMALAYVLFGEEVTEVLIDTDTARLCSTVNLYDERPEIFLTLDPIAADLTELAIQRAARSAGVEPETVLIGSVRPVQWAETPVSCDSEAVNLGAGTEGSAAGYRIVLTAGERDFVYHTDFDRLIPCSAE